MDKLHNLPTSPWARGGRSAGWRGPTDSPRIEKDLHQKAHFQYFSSIDNLLGVCDLFWEGLGLEVFPCFKGNRYTVARNFGRKP